VAATTLSAAAATIPALYDELLDNYTAQHAARVIVSIRVQ